MNKPLDTTRLQLFASTLVIEQAILAEDRPMVSQLTGFAVPAAWPGEDWCAVLPHFINIFVKHPEWCA